MTEQVDIGAVPEPNKNNEPSSAKLILTLGLAGFFSGVVLVGAYFITLPIIQANQARAQEQAIYKVLPGCTSFETLMLKNGQLKSIEVAEQSTEAEVIFAGYDQKKNLVGIAIPAQEIGFQDVIAGLMGYNPAEKTIIGFEVLESKETPGLGDKIFKDVAFKENFKALQTPGIITVKKGEKTKPNEVEAITGATISSKAVVRLLNKGLEQWKPAIEAAQSNLLKNKNDARN